MELSDLDITCRKIREQLDPVTLIELQTRLALIARNLDRGRYDAVKAIVEEMRNVLRSHVG
jgi:hypothetical protein